MAALDLQMAGHRITHHAQPEKCDFSQFLLSVYAILRRTRPRVAL